MGTDQHDGYRQEMYEAAEAFDLEMTGDPALEAIYNRLLEDLATGSDGLDPEISRRVLHLTWAQEARQNSGALAEIAAEIARVDNLNPVPDPPSIEDLSQFLLCCPSEDLEEANQRLEQIYGRPARWAGDGPVIMAARIGRELDSFDAMSLEEMEAYHREQEIHDIRQVDAAWKAAKGRDPRPLHPLSPLVRSWWVNRPKEIKPSTRTNGRIIPAKLAQGRADDHRTHKGLFLPPSHIAPGQQVLPGFQAETLRPAPPLELYEMGGGQHEGGRAVPLSQRMFVEALLAVPQHHRSEGVPVTYTVTLREFLSWFWPKRTPSPSEYWTQLNEAAEDLDKLRIPIINPKTGRGQARRLVSVVGIPRGARAMDDEVEVLVYLPADSDLGPQVSDQLRQWGNRSAPAWRALINLAYLWFDPGQTHAPIGRGRHQHWQRIHDPGRYAVLSDKDLVDLCFPTSQNQRRISRDLLPRAIRTLQSLEEAKELQIRGGKGRWQVLPPTPRTRAELE